MTRVGQKSGVLIAAAVVASLVACGLSTSAQERAKSPLTPGQAQSIDDSSSTVRVRGVLTNVGTNYFTDLRVVIADPTRPGEASLIVQPWLPTEVRPRPGGTKPPVLSDFLDKEVILTGQVAVRPVKGQPPAKTFIVKDAEVVGK